MRIISALAVTGVLLMASAPVALAQKHPTDKSVDLPGDNSPSSIERAHPQDRKTVPLPEKSERPAPADQPDQPLTRQPAANKGPESPGMSSNHQNLHSPSALQ
ncbi:hypothetical protein CFR75_11660 [Komagataeibacter xylinus]|uniref:Uncharacterized protein n=1 Tax=Komagataeibacter xylinus TaxID=28448 RepID=A0A318PGE8_KOMXY|nr:hypothetical protein [Komagataeibacter xylinus]AZV40070.1 hypothetical protein CXP35_02295 [Komagataeibacter xylinus]PYD56310.1 hypothetical protein CFR75_11660 [Komagataeibacter xylinus]GBQ68791.1 hypothetical protein AA15237_0468 [Komagataeibacter xylinus NBRC 15237]